MRATLVLISYWVGTSDSMMIPTMREARGILLSGERGQEVLFAPHRSGRGVGHFFKMTRRGAREVLSFADSGDIDMPAQYCLPAHASDIEMLSICVFRDEDMTKMLAPEEQGEKDIEQLSMMCHYASRR